MQFTIAKKTGKSSVKLNVNIQYTKSTPNDKQQDVLKLRENAAYLQFSTH